ncbi:MAG: hypothetical protein ACP5OU_07555 [Methanothrix sp.]
MILKSGTSQGGAPGSGLDQVRGRHEKRMCWKKLAEKIAACGVDQAGAKGGAAIG